MLGGGRLVIEINHERKCKKEFENANKRRSKPVIRTVPKVDLMWFDEVGQRHGASVRVCDQLASAAVWTTVIKLELVSAVFTPF